MGQFATGAVIVFIAMLIYLVVVWSIQRRLLFPRPEIPAVDVSGEVEGLEKLSVGEGVEAWLLPPLSGTSPYPVLIFAHGNGELIDFWATEFDVPREWGFGVLLVEYPGYGRSPGAPSQDSITATFVSAYDMLAARADVLSDAVVGYGRSLGGAAICRLSIGRSLAALVLESTFTGVRPFARSMAFPGFLVRDSFDNLAALRSYAGPVLLVHGTRDPVIPFHHAEALHRQSTRSRLEPVDCEHSDCPRPWRLLESFLGDAGLMPKEVPRVVPDR